MTAASLRSGRHVVRRAAASPLLLTSAAVVVALVVGYKLPDLVASYGPRDLLFLVAAAVIAGLGLRSSSFSITSVVAVFVFSALLRRLIPAADPSSDLAAIVPFVVGLPLAGRGLFAAKPVSVSIFLVWMTLSAGLALNSPLVGIAGWLNVAVPVLAAFGAARVPHGLQTLALATVLCGALAATYGIVQYFVTFPWDAAWLASTEFASVGSFDDPTFRPFATLPAPATAATVSAAVILLLVARRDVIGLPVIVRGWALGASVMLLLLAQVRSVWLALGVAIVVRVLASSGRSLRQVAAPVVIVMMVVLFSPQREILIGRAQTFTELGTDASYQSRVGILSGAGRLVSPVGSGLGTYSSGSRASSNRSVDNGYLVVLGEMGIVGIGLLVWVLAVVLRKAKRSDYPFVALLVVLNAAGFALGNFTGLLLWAFSGITRTGDEEQAVSPPKPESLAS